MCVEVTKYELFQCEKLVAVYVVNIIRHCAWKVKR